MVGNSGENPQAVEATHSSPNADKERARLVGVYMNMIQRHQTIIDYAREELAKMPSISYSTIDQDTADASK